MAVVERWVVVEESPLLHRGLQAFKTEKAAREDVARRTPSGAVTGFRVERVLETQPDDHDEHGPEAVPFAGDQALAHIQLLDSEPLTALKAFIEQLTVATDPIVIEQPRDLAVLLADLSQSLEPVAVTELHAAATAVLADHAFTDVELPDVAAKVVDAVELVRGGRDPQRGKPE